MAGRTPMQLDAVAAPTRTQVLGALSHAQDLAEGQPAGHVNRAAALAARIAETLGWGAAARADLVHAALLKDAGCSSNAARLAWVMGADDRALKSQLKLTDWTRLPARAAYAARAVLPQAPAPRRAARVAWLALGGDPQRDLVAARCERGADIATWFGFGPEVARAVRELDEHWDGRGRPRGLAGEAISPLARVLCLAQSVDVFRRERGPDAAWRMARARRGRWFEPEVVDALLATRADAAFWAALDGGELERDPAAWAPEPHARRADEAWLDRVAEGFALVIDAKSPYTAAHSRRVAALTDAAAGALAIGPGRRRELRRAALLHDIGKLALSNRILDKRGPLDAAERAEVREHPRHTGRILARVAGLEGLASDAAAHHERLDGSGYPDGLRGSALSREARLLAVADVFEAMTSPRPYRGPLPPGRALAELQEEAGRTLDAECVAALRATAAAG